MKVRQSLLLLVVLSCACSAVAEPVVKDGDLVAIVGDSITEQKLYSVFIEDYLLMCKPAGKDVRTMQFGWGGETSWGFVARMDNDCLRFKPNVMTTCYGMNDGGYGPLSEERAGKYRQSMEQILAKFKDAGGRTIVVGSPGVVDTYYFARDPKNPQPRSERAEVYNKTLAKLRDIDREMAEKQQLPFADVHAAMMDAMTKAKAALGNDYSVAGMDGVHPAANGHLVMAYAFLKAMGCDGDIGTITVDLRNQEATATPGHHVKQSRTTARASVELNAAGATSRNRVKESPVEKSQENARAVTELDVESERYPFCFYGDNDKPNDPKSPSSMREIIKFFPFNQDLNRFTLVVKYAPTDRVKITWGNASKEYAKSDLERGVNLAADFLDNPFSAQFKKVHDAVRAQQNFETVMIKNLIHGVWEAMPDEKELLEKTVEATSRKDQALSKSAHELVTPVTHTIRIEAVK